VLIIFYLERKIAAFMQDRLGPTHVGLYGMLQPIADLAKLLQKEDIIPDKADKTLFKLGPFIIFSATFCAFAAVPLSNSFQPSAPITGTFFIISIVGIDVIGLLMSGYASNNKYALFGAMRSVAQMISYEIPLALSVLSVVMLMQTMDLQEMSFLQNYHSISNPDSIANWGGIFAWNIVRAPFLILTYIVFFIATLAECNRVPFDIPEAESELVAGFHVEYSGFRFAKFFLAEYGMMLLVSLLGAFLFFGGWNSPFPNIGSFNLNDYTTGSPNTMSGALWGAFWLFIKAFIPMVVMVWLRWTLPRLRVDQVMSLCWKYLTPAALLSMILAAFWRVVVW
jgi:NADH-quinone oxidoreductase subunit H